MPSAPNLQSVAERIELLVDELSALGDGRGGAREKANELVQLLMRFYGDGLARVLEIVDEESSEDARRLFGKFESDPLVASLLILHDLHPVSAEVRVAGALERARAELETPLTLVEVANGVARVRAEPALSLNGDGRHASAKLRKAIEQAIEAVAPEIESVEIDGLWEEAPALVQLARAPV
ncbi:MAG TPA: hypothetical protein VGG84_00985 [Gemmatimonadaceae bacterium]